MTAATERRVDINAVVAERQGCERFSDEYGNMTATGYRHAPR